MFSNATEAMSWQEHNCYNCWKYNSEGTEREKMKCRIGYDIDLGYITGELSCRVNKITEMRDCPFRKEKRPVYKKRHDSAMPLFEGGNMKRIYNKGVFR